MSLGGFHARGQSVQRDLKMAFRLRTRAAGMGHPEAAAYRAKCYRTAYFVDTDREEEIKWLRIAAKRGYVKSRVELGICDMQNTSYASGIAHFVAAAEQGCKEGVDEIRECYTLNLVSKDTFTNALRAYQAAQLEMKSDGRDNCGEYMKFKTQHAECRRINRDPA